MTQAWSAAWQLSCGLELEFSNVGSKKYSKLHVACSHLNPFESIGVGAIVKILHSVFTSLMQPNHDWVDSVGAIRGAGGGYPQARRRGVSLYSTSADGQQRQQRQPWASAWRPLALWQPPASRRLALHAPQPRPPRPRGPRPSSPASCTPVLAGQRDDVWPSPASRCKGKKVALAIHPGAARPPPASAAACSPRPALPHHPENKKRRPETKEKEQADGGRIGGPTGRPARPAPGGLAWPAGLVKVR